MPKPCQCTEKIAVPSVHLNGTGKDHLVKSHLKARYAIKDAIEALAENAPHGRDYYVQEDGAFQTARDEHRARLLKLNEVYEELEHILRHLTESS